MEYRASTGIEGLDRVFYGLRLGDNVVWQTDNIYDYNHYLMPFVKKALEEKRTVIYMRFAEHKPLLIENEAIKVYKSMQKLF